MQCFCSFFAGFTLPPDLRFILLQFVSFLGRQLWAENILFLLEIASIASKQRLKSRNLLWMIFSRGKRGTQKRKHYISWRLAWHDGFRKIGFSVKEMKIMINFPNQEISWFIFSANSFNFSYSAWVGAALYLGHVSRTMHFRFLQSFILWHLNNFMNHVAR